MHFTFGMHALASIRCEASPANPTPLLMRPVMQFDSQAPRRAHDNIALEARNNSDGVGRPTKIHFPDSVARAVIGY